MFGFSWGEIGIIMAVALIAIGPKDLPVAVRTVTGLIKRARGMAAEFQGHVDEMMREANIADVVGDIKKATQGFPGATGLDSIKDFEALKAKVAVSPGYKAPAEVAEELPDAPRFIPPDAARKPPVPAFIPPGTKRWGF